MLANPDEPCYAVVFTSRRRTDGEQVDDDGYGEAAERMLRLAAEQDGFLGVDSVRDAAGVGITVSYWRDLEAIRDWHALEEHRAVQQLGRDRWYEAFTVRVCRVERAYSFLGAEADESPPTDAP